jgi:outer membrane protein OmpA-like peptidoglycan-associated protein
MHNNTSSTTENWMSISDIMTALMVIFLFISISYMMEVNKQQDEIEEIINTYKNTKEAIRNDLTLLLEEDLEKWSKYIEFDSSNLSIKFIGQDIQFRPNDDRIQSNFKNILNDFLPKYINVLAKDKYKDKISEVRIEGHANNPYIENTATDNYLNGISWSQRRAKSVLAFTVQHPFFESLADDTKRRLEFWLVANGYGYGRTLDDSGMYTQVSDQEICEECSRRVEFRIITISEQVIADIIDQIK